VQQIRFKPFALCDRFALLHAHERFNVSVEETMSVKFIPQWIAAVATAALATIPIASSAFAQTWPTKPITLVVPYAAGGGLDAIARFVANAMTEKLGQQVIVDIKAGANGTIGTAYAAKAAPDGYTFLIDPGGPIVNSPFMTANLPYDPEKDLVPITKVADTSLVIVANANFPANDMTGLIAYAKANPDKVLAANVGVGSGGHLAALLLEKQTGIKLKHIPYRGTGQMMADLLSGQVHITVNFFSGLASGVDAKTLKLIGVAGPAIPEALKGRTVQTSAEAGLPKYNVEGWYGLFAPKGVSPDILAKVNQVVTDYLKTPAAKTKMMELGLEPAPTTPAQLSDFVAQERKVWGELIKEVGIVAE
jgi:tripartite-type tricarboxylate transporter receptor subunit TctC